MALKRRLSVLWGTLVGALVAAMVVVSFFAFAQSGEATPQGTADKQPYASVSPRIVGGTGVPNGKYPFLTLLNFTDKYGNSVGQCGGSLIDPDSVLTAGHCFYDPNTGKLIPRSIKLQVIVGRTVRSSNQGQVRSVKGVSIHPDFKFDRRLINGSYDAAVVELSRPVWSITPIKLATSKQNYLERPGRDATVAGWGNTIPPHTQPPGGAHIPLRMQEAQVPIVSDYSAEQAYDPRPETRLTRTFVYSPPLMVAAGGKGKDPCQGDSGGPLFFARGPNHGGGDDNSDDSDNGDDGSSGGSGGKYTQIGIVSFGMCAYKDFPAGYAEVNNPSIRSFIKSAASK